MSNALSVKFYDYNDDGEPVLGLYAGSQLLSLHDSEEEAWAAAPEDVGEYVEELENPVKRGRAGHGDPRPAFH